MYSIYFTTSREPDTFICASPRFALFGVSFITLKIVAVFAGLLTLPFIYLLEKELAANELA
ncbi:MAG: hypothetical protein U0Z26_07970 [Anaerolineales bacterium]